MIDGNAPGKACNRVGCHREAAPLGNHTPLHCPIVFEEGTSHFFTNGGSLKPHEEQGPPRSNQVRACRRGSGFDSNGKIVLEQGSAPVRPSSPAVILHNVFGNTLCHAMNLFVSSPNVAFCFEFTSALECQVGVQELIAFCLVENYS